MPVPKINLSDLISPEEEGKKYIGPNINWEAIPKFLSDLLTLMDPSGMMLAMAPVSKASKLVEGHHTLPIGGQRNLAATEWHLRNPEEGWKTIKDIPKEVHKKLTKKQMSKLNKEVSLSDVLSIEDREKIYSRLMTSPERKELLSPDRLGELENLFAEMPKGTKAHLFGSVVSSKPNPKDLDVLLELPGVAEWMRAQPWFASAKGGIPPRITIPKVDLIPSPPLKEVPNNIKKMKEIGKKKYGEDYDFLRILSILGLLPLSSMVESEK